jgi:hypothetical protein
VRAFHPARLHAALQELAAAHGDASSAGGTEDSLTLEGLAWLPTQPSLQGLVRTNPATGAYLVEPGDAWWACIPRDRWPEGLANEIMPLWHEPYGDRQTEITIRCISADVRQRVQATLEACLLRDDEAPPAIAADVDLAEHLSEFASRFDDPFAEAWAPILAETAEAERLAKIDEDVKSAFRKAPRARTVATGLSIGGKLKGAAMICTPCNP